MHIDLHIPEIHITVNLHDDVALNLRLDRIDTQLDRLERVIKNDQGELMALTKEEIAFIERLANATTKLSDRIDKLIANPPDTVAEFIAQLQPIADNLDAMGTDPNDPLPPLPDPTA